MFLSGGVILKMICSVMLLMAVLTGCASPVYETLADVVPVGQNRHTPRQILLQLPKDANLLTFSGEDRLYLCDGYTLTLQILPSGDLGATVRQISGRELPALTWIESVCADHVRRDMSWTAMADQGQMVCRGAILDDGHFHYSLTVMAYAEDAAGLQQEWNAVFSSFCLETASS
jgi:hypothetical protein